MLDARAICETCGHMRDWHDRDAVRARLHADPGIEGPCYRRIGGAPCRCSGFRDSGTVVVPAGSPSMGSPASEFAVVRVAVLTLLLIVLGLGLLYAYRSQTPTAPQVDIGRALQDINAGRIRAVTIFADKAILEFKDGPSHKEQTALPDTDTVFVLQSAVSNYNAAHPSEPTELRVEARPPWCCGLDRLAPIAHLTDR